MEHYKKKHSIYFRVVAAILVCVFALTNIPHIEETHALAPWAGTMIGNTRAESLVKYFKLYRRIKYATNEEDRRLLEEYRSRALLIPTGQILLSEELEGNPAAILRAIIHEEIEALMQVIAQDESDRYEAIKKLIRSRFPAVAGVAGEESPDLKLNHILARAFELLILTKKPGDNPPLIQKESLPEAERQYLEKIRSLITQGKGKDLFTPEFWNWFPREMRIRLAIANGMSFDQVASGEEPAGPAREPAADDTGHAPFSDGPIGLGPVHIDQPLHPSSGDAGEMQYGDDEGVEAKIIKKVSERTGTNSQYLTSIAGLPLIGVKYAGSGSGLWRAAVLFAVLAASTMGFYALVKILRNPPMTVLKMMVIKTSLAMSIAVPACIAPFALLENSPGAWFIFSLIFSTWAWYMISHVFIFYYDELNVKKVEKIYLRQKKLESQIIQKSPQPKKDARAPREYIKEWLRIESFGSLIRGHFADKKSISGLDFGAGSGEKTVMIKKALEENFRHVHFVGMETNPKLVMEAEEVKRPVIGFDVKSLTHRAGKARAKYAEQDLITMFNVIPTRLGDFIKAAKRAVKKDGLIVISFHKLDMEKLLKGDKVAGAIKAKAIRKKLADFKLVRLMDTQDISPIEGMSLNPFVFVYSPEGFDSPPAPARFEDENLVFTLDLPCPSAIQEGQQVIDRIVCFTKRLESDITKKDIGRKLVSL